MEEIERKFLVKSLPNLKNVPKVTSTRYFLVIETGVEVRIQSKGDTYEIEGKVETSALSRSGWKQKISKKEFDALKKLAKKSLVRDNYYISDGLSVKIYHGEHKGLMRAEIEFANESEAKKFKPLPWMGSEITHTELGRDAKLIQLDQKKVKILLKKYS